MKYLTLFVTLVIVGLLLSSVAYGSKAKTGTAASNGTGAQLADQQAARVATKVKALNDRERTTEDYTALRSSKITPRRVASAAIPYQRPAPFASPLSGSYDVGAGGAYTTLLAAFNALNANGVSGAVTLNMTDASYNTPPLVLYAVAGASSTNTITLRPKAGTAVQVHFQSFPSFGSGLSLASTTDFILDGVNSGGASLKLDYQAGTAFPYADANAATILITGTSSRIQIKNTTIYGITDNPGDLLNSSDARQGIHLNTGSGGATLTDIVIDANTFGDCYYAILSDGAGAGNEIVNGTISNNKIGSGVAGGALCGQGIVIEGGTNVDVTGNEVKGIAYNDEWLNPDGSFNDAGLPNFFPTYTGPSAFVAVENAFIFGIGLLIVDGTSSLVGNVVDDYNAHMDPSSPAGEIDYVHYAIRIQGVSAAQQPTAYNNTITRIYTDNDIFAQHFSFRSSNAKLYHNSVYLSGSSEGFLANCFRPSGAGELYNNAMYDDMTMTGFFATFGFGGGTTAFNTANTGASNNNAIGVLAGANRRATSSGTLAQLVVATGKDTLSSEGNPNFTSTTNLHLNPAALTSTAQNIGRGGLTAGPDIDAQVRSVSTPDAGVDEAAIAIAPPVDVAVGGILLPTAGGFLSGTSSQMRMQVDNYADAGTSVDVQMYVDSAGTIVYTASVAGVALAARGQNTATMATSWTPLGSTGYKVVAKITSGGGSVAANDSLFRNQTISSIFSLPYSTNFGTTGTANTAGWSTTGSWVRNTFTKLGGPRGGSGRAYVTAATGTYTAATNHRLITPYFNTTGLTNVYIGWFQSLKTEPSWDRSLLEYTIDTGKTWRVVGVLNDPKGINWYATSTYANAAGNAASCWDEVTSGTQVFPFRSVDRSQPPPGWTSDGDCAGDDVHTGPNGYIFVQYHFSGSDTVLNKPAVGFRYAAFSDAGGVDEGWAIDDFFINTTGNPSTGTISGNVYDDANGNAAKDGGELNITGQTLYLTGSFTDTTTSDISGNYSFTGLFAGVYKVTSTASAGAGYTEPEDTTGEFDHITMSYNYLMGPGQNFPGSDFGEFEGGVTGLKFKDNNANEQNDSEPGLSGWVIEAHRDSLTGELAGTATTNGSGNYNLRLGAGDYVISEVLKSGWKQTYPSGGSHDVTIVDTSGSPNANPSGKEFGNFKLGKLTVFSTEDLNGDGAIAGGDHGALPLAVNTDFELTKNGAAFATFSVGNSIDVEFVTDLDVGTYVLTQVAHHSSLTSTLDPVHVMNVFTSGVDDTADYLSFRNGSLKGRKYDDANGDGIATGDAGLAGWAINLTGPVTASDTTDGSGNYLFTNLPPGVYTVTEVGQAGWQATNPPSGSAGVTVNFSGRQYEQDFGNFDKVCVSGTKYRDRNNNGTRDGSEEGLSGWTIRLGVLSTTTDANGDYSFCNVGPGTDTLREDQQVGFVMSEPAAGYYVIARSSGTDVAGKNFGNFGLNDSTKYRTWTVAELSGDGEKKPGKAYKPGKAADPLKNYVNSANLIKDLIAQGAVLQVGLSGQMNVGNKEKAYLNPAKQSGAFETFNKKGSKHDTANSSGRGFDSDVKAKALLKKLKSLPATKKSSKTISELLALKINIRASEKLKYIGGNLGDLVISNGGTWDGRSIYQFAAAADSYMTNWEGVPYSVYTDICATASMINSAFSTGSTSDTATGWAGVKLTWKATKSVRDVPTLKQAKASARPPVEEKPLELPSVYALGQNYPNPFNPTTYLSFDLPEPAVVTLKVYNMLGQEIVTLLNNEAFDAGNEEVEFDASSLSSGVYLYRITASSVDDDGNIITNNVFTTVKKMLLVK